MATDRTTRPGTAHDLHVLVARLDRVADRILRSELEVSYPRFLALLTLHRTGPVTQRRLADELGVTEPTAGRTVAVLGQAGLVTIGMTPGSGNRRSVSLTPLGAALVARGGDRLEDAFGALAAAADVDQDVLASSVRRLLEALNAGEA
jgi:DNA-binding MarR family transcriptional regulator